VSTFIFILISLDDFVLDAFKTYFLKAESESTYKFGVFMACSANFGISISLLYFYFKWEKTMEDVYYT
jgi:hypothetical protein